MQAHSNKAKIESLNRLKQELMADSKELSDIRSKERDLMFDHHKSQKSGDKSQAQEIKKQLDALKTPEMLAKKERLVTSISEKSKVIPIMEKEIYGKSVPPDSPDFLRPDQF